MQLKNIVSVKVNEMTVEKKASIVYVIASFICKGFSIVTIPFFTHIMSTEEIGIVSIFNSWWAILFTVGTLGLTSGGFFTCMTEYETQKNKYMSSVLSLITISIAIIFMVCLFNIDLIEQLMAMDRVLIYILLLSICLEAAKDIWMMGQRYEYKYKSVFVVTVLPTLLSVFFSILIVWLAKNQKCGDLANIRIISTYSVLLLFDFVIYVSIFKKGKVLINKEYWKVSLCLSIPLIFNALAKNALDVSDRIMIARFVGESEAGIYSTVYNISSLIVIIWTAINSAFIPFLFKNLKDDSVDLYERIKRFINPLLMVYVVFTVIMTLIAPEVIRLMTSDEYIDAIEIIPPVVAGVFFVCMYNLFSNVLVYHKKTQYIMISTIVACVVNIIGNYLLIPIWGYKAAAYTTLIAYVVLSLFQYITMKLVEKRKIYDERVFFMLSSLVVLFNILSIMIYDYIIVRYGVLLVGLVALCFIYKKGGCK